MDAMDRMSLQSSNSHAAKRPRLEGRTMLACTGCKQRKLKCDGQSPRCQNCERTGRDCLVEDPATGLQRPRDYMQSLEARVAYLEGLLQDIRPDVAADHFGTDGEPGPGSQSLRSLQFGQVNPGREVARAQSSEVEEQKVDELSSEVALLCLSAAGREPHYFGPSSAVSFSRIVSATMGLSRKGGASRPSLDGDRGANLPDKREEKLQYPSAAARASLSRAFFDNIHPQYPFLHRPTFRAWEEACVDFFEEKSMEVNKVALFFVLMVYAIGSLGLGQSQMDAAQSYYSAALDHISVVLDLDSLESIQAILCCAVYSIRSPVGVSLWKVSGMAIRHCIELGYHRSAETYRKHADTLTKEMSKRCFWVAYDIDRVAAFILGRPVGVPEDAIDVELPLDIDDENITPAGLRCEPRTTLTNPPTLMTGSIHAIKLRRLWTKIVDVLYPTNSQRHKTTPQKCSVEALRQELEEWRASTPDQLDYSRSHPLSVFASSQWFPLAYDHAILVLYRHYICGAALGQHREHSTLSEITEKAFEECFVRSREMCLLYRRVYQSPTVQFTWGSLHILFTGGLTYLYCLWRSERIRSMARQTDVINTCMACTTVLVIIAERWKLATSYRDIFETLSERTISMICGGGKESDLAVGFTGSQTLPAAGPTFVEADMPPLQDWIMGLDEMSIPQDSEWLVHELLQDVQEFQEQDFAYAPETSSAGPNLLREAFDPTLADGNHMSGNHFETRR